MRNLVKLYSSRDGAPFFVKVIVQCIKEGQKKKEGGGGGGGGQLRVGTPALPRERK